MLELGVTPSHVSLAVGEMGEKEEEREKEEEEGEEEESYRIPLESLGLGGNQISDLGASSLADGLKNNTSEWKVSHHYTLVPQPPCLQFSGRSLTTTLLFPSLPVSSLVEGLSPLHSCSPASLSPV